jgi:DNA gyrase subunit A
MSNLTPIIEQSFIQYAGAVLQSRALVDARDCLKPSARQIFYCMYTDKFTHDKPFKKTLKAIGSAMRMYIHGDSSCEGIIMRAGQPFALRYPLVEVEGSYGNLMETGNWAAPRYTASRLSSLSNYLFGDINKDTIDEWRDNYDDTEKYPAVLTSKGFYNIVNGCMGIGVGASSSIPQFNIKEVNSALRKLLWNPEIDFEEIYCAPDFATGAILYNEKEVKESLKNGTGKACRLRAVVEYDEKERALIVTQLPYSVYTNTICGQLEELIELNIGIDKFNDLTGKEPLIKIYLSKNASPEKVLKRLYKDTSLQYHYGINLTMLENGRYPRVFTWKEALQSYLNHQTITYRRAFEYDLAKIKARLHIVEGILIALANIEEVIKVIKNSSTTASANTALQTNFNLSEIQAKAILDIKLARLAHLEIEKYIKEKEDLLLEKGRIEAILNDEVLLKKEIDKDLRSIEELYGDSRRTQILNLDIDKESDEPIEKKNLIIHLTNKGNFYTFENSTLMSQRRGGRGTNLKLDNDESIIDTITCVNDNNCLVFSNKGKAYALDVTELPIGQKYNVNSMFEFEDDEKVNIVFPFNKINERNYAVFATKNGLVKKTSLEEYRLKRGKAKGVIAIKLRDNDELVSVSVIERNSPFGFLTKDGNSVIINIDSVSNTGRATSGVIGIKLSEGDEVVDAKPIKHNTKQIISLSSRGNTKKTDYDSFCIGNRATKGVILQKTKEDDHMIGFNTIEEGDKEVAFVSNKGIIRVSLDDIPLLGRATFGCKAKQLKDNEFMLSILKVI